MPNAHRGLRKPLRPLSSILMSATLFSFAMSPPAQADAPTMLAQSGALSALEQDALRRYRAHEPDDLLAPVLDQVARAYAMGTAPRERVIRRLLRNGYAKVPGADANAQLVRILKAGAMRDLTEREEVELSVALALAFGPTGALSDPKTAKALADLSAQVAPEHALMIEGYLCREVSMSVPRLIEDARKKGSIQDELKALSVAYDASNKKVGSGTILVLTGKAAPVEGDTWMISSDGGIGHPLKTCAKRGESVRPGLGLSPLALCNLDTNDKYACGLAIQPCEQGDGDACAAAALFTNNALKGLEKTKAYADKACRLGSDEGCGLKWAVAFFETQGQEPSRSNLAAVCDKGVRRACQTYAEGQRDFEKRGKWKEFFQQGHNAAGAACNLGDTLECAEWAANVAERTPREKWSKDVLPKLKQGCDRGNGRACVKLAHMPRVSHADAIGLFDRACAYAHPRGCMYAMQRRAFLSKSDADWRRFRTMVIKYCEDGTDDFACEAAGDVTISGLGGPKDETRGRQFYSRACRGGFPKSCRNVARLAYEGVGGPRVPAVARQLANKHCSQSHPTICYILGDLVVKGEGGGTDLDLARKAFATGCKGGHDLSCQRAKEVSPEGVNNLIESLWGKEAAEKLGTKTK